MIKMVYWMAGILRVGLDARRTVIPKTLTIMKIALIAEAEELYPKATKGGAPGGVEC